MPLSSAKLTNPLKIGAVYSALTFFLFLIVMGAMLFLSDRENTLALRSLSHVILKARPKDIKADDFRELVENAAEDFPDLYVKLMAEDGSFEFGRSPTFASCFTGHLRNHSSQFSLKLCKPLFLNLPFVFYLLLAYGLLSIAILLFPFREERIAVHNLKTFLQNIGLTLPSGIGFGEILNQLGSLQGEISKLKLKIAYVSEQKAVTTIASYLAHDMRSPLLVFQEVLRVKNEEDLSKLKPRIFSSLNRVHTMINSLQEKSLTAVYPTVVEGLDFSCVLHESHILARSHKVKLISHELKSEKVYIDKEKMDRVVANLLRNAVESAKTLVVLEVRLDMDALNISVWDDGPGIDPAIEPFIFKELFSFGKPHGTGLGLSYAKQVVEAHGGKISVLRRKNMTVFELSIAGSRVKDMPSQHVTLPLRAISGRSSKVLVVLKHRRLFLEFRNRPPSKDWVTVESLDQVRLLSFGVIYSDDPEAIRLATQNGLRPIIALASDTYDKALRKIRQTLDHKQRTTI